MVEWATKPGTVITLSQSKQPAGLQIFAASQAGTSQNQLERDEFRLNHHRALAFCLSISPAFRLRVSIAAQYLAITVSSLVGMMRTSTALPSLLMRALA
jgi:hypothetical protein